MFFFLVAVFYVGIFFGALYHCFLQEPVTKLAWHKVIWFFFRYTSWWSTQGDYLSARFFNS